MKKKFLGIVMSLVLLITCGFCLTACRKMDNYFAVVCTDQDYKATLNYKWGVEGYDYEENWTVLRTKATICGQERDVIYVEYSHTDNSNDSHNYERTLLYTYNNGEGYVLRLNGDSWESYTGSFGDKWSDIYGSYSKPGSFVYELTQKINGRDFPADLKREGDGYIEYDFNSYNEVFRISNDEYHILLYYCEGSHTLKQATFNYGTPSDTIAHLSTITHEMIGE